MTEGDEKRLAAETIAWLREREGNCRRIAKAKVGSDRDGWLEDAAYFNSAITLLARATQAESALAAAREVLALYRYAVDFANADAWDRGSDMMERFRLAEERAASLGIARPAPGEGYKLYRAALTPETP